MVKYFNDPAKNQSMYVIYMSVINYCFFSGRKMTEATIDDDTV